MDWKLIDAKNRLSELVTKVATEGPQTIVRFGKRYVVVAEEQWREARGERLSLRDLLLRGPDLTGVLEQRDQSPMRDVEL